MKKLYYVVTKQLQQHKDYQVTSGYKDIALYEIKDNELIELVYLEEVFEGEHSEDILKEFIEEFVPEYDIDDIQFIKL